MSHGTGTDFDRLGYLINLLGPEQAAALTRDLTADQAAKLDAYFEQNAPAHKLVWDALDADGSIRDPQAFERLKSLASETD